MRLSTALVPLLAPVLLVASAPSCVGDDPIGASSGGASSSSGASSGSSGASSGSSGASASSGGADGGPATCGVPGAPCCEGVCRSGSTCTGGACACAATQTACDGACVDLQSDPRNCGGCGHDCFAGACVAGACKAFNVATAQSNVAGITTKGDRAYWTQYNGAGTPGAVLSAKLDGSGDVRTHYRGPVTASCGPLAFDGDHAYFVCGGDLLHCAMPACTPNDVLVARAALGAAGVAVDPATHRVFYTITTEYGKSTGGGVYYLDGNNLAAAAIAIGAKDPPTPTDVVVDGGFVYWLLSGTYAADVPQKNGGVRRLPLGGLSGSESVVATAPTDADLLALAADDVNVYFVGVNQSPGPNAGTYPLRAAPVGGGGGAASAFVRETGGPGGVARAIVADRTNLYYASPADAAIMRCPKTGCAQSATKHTAGEIGAVRLGHDARSLVWSTAAGDIRRVAK